jgi:hypothetical protein
MTKVRDHHRRWSRDADYKDAFDALGEEFDLARALIEARTAAGLSQSQLAKKMKTSQSYIARIEGRCVREIVLRSRAGGHQADVDPHAAVRRRLTLRPWPQSGQSTAIDADSSSELATCRASSRSAGGTGVCRITSRRRAKARSRADTRVTLTLRSGSDQIFTELYRGHRAFG